MYRLPLIDLALTGLAMAFLFFEFYTSPFMDPANFLSKLTLQANQAVVDALVHNMELIHSSLTVPPVCYTTFIQRTLHVYFAL